MVSRAFPAVDDDAHLPPRHLRPQRVFDLDVVHRYPERFNSTDLLIDQHLSRGRGEHPALRYRNQTLTYAELARQVNQLGNGLRRLGVHPGDRVLIHSLNEPQAAVTNFAALKLGAVVVPTSPLLTPEQLAHIIGDCEPVVVVVDAMLLGTVLGARELAPARRHIVVFDAEPGVVENSRCHCFADLLASGEPELAPMPRPRDAVSVLLYTSGLAQPARATAHLQDELLVIPDIFGRRAWEVRPDDVIAGAGPICFAGGYSTLLTVPFRFGATTVLIPLGTSAEAMFPLVREHQVTLLAAMPTLYRQMAEVSTADPTDLATLRMVSGGGESLSPATVTAWRDRFGLDIYEGFGTNGMTHVFITTAVTRSITPGSMGRPLPGYRVRVLRPDGRDARPGEPGQLHARGPVGTLYWGHPDAAGTVAALQARTVRDGWVRIGDWVSQDPDGSLRFVAREEELFTRGHVEFGPGEVETVLAQHPDVAEAGVYGSVAADGVQRVHALIVALSPAVLTEDLPRRVLRDSATALGPRVPDDITAVQRLPRTPFGTLLRRNRWPSWLDTNHGTHREEVTAHA